MLPSTTDRRPVAVGDAAALTRRMVSPRTGLLSRLHHLPVFAGDFPLASVTAAIANLEALPHGAAIGGGGASGADLDGGVLRALMESIERYCAAFSERMRLRFARARGDEFLLGDELPLYAEHQYRQRAWPYRRLTRDSEIHWAAARSLATGRRRFLPAIMVYLPYRTDLPDEWICPSLSTGLACDWSRDRAVLTGLLEVCERDAFMITWLNRLSRPRLQVVPGSPLERRLQPLIDGSHAQISFVDLTTDLDVPVVMAVCRRPLWGQPLITVGLSARPRRTEAAFKAFTEAAAEYARLRDLLGGGDTWRPEPDFRNVADFPLHSQAYVDPANQAALRFLTASPVEWPLVDDPGPELPAAAQVERYAARLAARGVDALVADLTTDDVRPSGLHVVKVVAPRAVPINAHHLAPPLGHERVFTVPRALGARPDRSRLDDLELHYPHPFA